jgi:hypothetical protein
MIDTLKLAERIERELHASPEYARTTAHIVRDILTEATADLATKNDLVALRNDLTAALAEQKSTLVMWFAGILIAHAIGTTGLTLAGVYFLLSRFVGGPA